MKSLPNRLKDVSPEIIYSDGGFLAAGDEIVSLLKNRAGKSPRRRCRMCFHANPDALQQEMLIAMHRTSYVRPHRHLEKAETLTVIEGNCDAIVFDGRGTVIEVLAMSPPAGGGSFFYRMPAGTFHTLMFRSDWLVFLETTIGPFGRAMTEMANWAPPESDQAAGRAYLSNLSLPKR